ncbi:MAG TPA: alpha/beta hydrolase [Thermoplasmata archaeon]|nr:alpha/beta hydrolase [Thermoplasmata archaeon]
MHLYYEIHGSARAGSPPLPLLHGGGSTIQTSFGAILPPLAGTRRVIAFEQQGHGHTADVPDRPFSFEQSAKDAVALLRHLHVDRADVLGYSNGGHIAIQIQPSGKGSVVPRSIRCPEISGRPTSPPHPAPESSRPSSRSR